MLLRFVRLSLLLTLFSNLPLNLICSCFRLLLSTITIKLTASSIYQAFGSQPKKKKKTKKKWAKQNRNNQKNQNSRARNQESENQSMNHSKRCWRETEKCVIWNFCFYIILHSPNFFFVKSISLVCSRWLMMCVDLLVRFWLLWLASVCLS